MPRNRFLSSWLLAVCLALASCVPQVGPRTVHRARFDYNEALVHSWNQQLLLNLVRLRYRDNPLFLEVGSVVTQFTVGASASASGDTGGGDVGLGVELQAVEQPTVTYAPLQGEAFVTSLLSPISPSTLVLLSQSGWSVERLLLCCVQRMNALGNAVAAAGPTPDYVPEYQDFQRFARLLRELQVAGRLEVELRRRPGPSGETEDFDVLLRLAPPEGASAEANREVRRLLGVGEEGTRFRIAPAPGGREGDEIAVAGRSLLAVMFFLSQGVEPPEEHVKRGLVTVTRGPGGEPFDWAEVTGRLMRVHSGSRPPSGAFVRVRYRGAWFWIADDDLNSKTTFNLLTYLFALKSGAAGGREPLLTLGLGG
jgi:hypothetical protein